MRHVAPWGSLIEQSGIEIWYERVFLCVVSDSLKNGKSENRSRRAKKKKKFPFGAFGSQHIGLVTLV